MSSSNTQKLRLLPEYFASVKRGEKKSTIRVGRRKLSKGTLILESNQERLKVELRYIAHKHLKDLTENDAQIDGFRNLAELRKALFQIYSNLKPDSLLTIIYFELPDGNNIRDF